VETSPPRLERGVPIEREVLVRADTVRVRYGRRWALDGLSFEVAAGEIVGLLGPNGAGKTTALSVLATLLPPDGGAVEVGGHSVTESPARVRRLLGLVPQSLALYPTLTARENARFFARLLGLRGRAAREAARRALALVGLEDRADEPVSAYSGGMQRRLNLACGLLREPRVLLLDEPTVGVDPQSRERIFAAVRDQAARGAAVVYSTNYMEEAERLCDRVVLVDHGSVVASGAPVELVHASGRALRLEVITLSPLPDAWLAGIDGVRRLNASHEAFAAARGSGTQVAVDDFAIAPRVLERAAALGGEVLDFHLHQPGLQDVFLQLTGHALRD
jgi:ABC-2 type transport system ATP-binding protein